MCFDIGHHEKFCVTYMHLNLARSKFWDFFTKYFWTLHNCENYHFRNLFNDYIDGERSLFFHLLPLVYQSTNFSHYDGSFSRGRLQKLSFCVAINGTGLL